MGWKREGAMVHEDKHDRFHGGVREDKRGEMGYGSTSLCCVWGGMFSGWEWNVSGWVRVGMHGRICVNMTIGWVCGSRWEDAETWGVRSGGG